LRAARKRNCPNRIPRPPSLVWNVFNYATNAQADHNGNPTINVKHGEKYRITLKANDPEGVKQIQINPTIGSGDGLDLQGTASWRESRTE